MITLNHKTIKYQDRPKLFYMDTASFVFCFKTKDFYDDIANDVKKWFDTSNYDEDDKRSLTIGKNIKVIGLLKMRKDYKRICWT